VKTRFPTLLLVLMLAAWPCRAIDFTITEIVPVGPYYGGGMYRPAQWSPNGTMLAYFSDGKLLVSDTLGNSRTVTEIELAPHRYVWASDDEIVLFQRTFDTGHVIINRLSRVNIDSGEESVIAQYTRCIGRHPDSGGTVFRGPYKTIEGSAYYRVAEAEAERIRVVQPSTANEEEVAGGQSPQHILRTGEDALYLVRTDQQDSIKISNKPYRSHMALPMSLSPDRTHVMFGGYIVRLADDRVIILDTLAFVKERPEGTTGCGFGDESFNPVAPEVACNLSCDDGHSYIVDRIVIFDYGTNDLTILDTLTGVDNCRRPSYSPDGRRIAFVSAGVLYFLTREYEQ
jgi:hypothetical protein